MVIDRQRTTIIQLLLLTGCRRSEILNLKWSEVKGQRLLLSDSKTGPKTVWIGREARDVLSTLPRRRGRDHVFWNEAADRPFRCVREFWLSIREAASLPPLRLDDLRHSFASRAAARSETLPMIGKLLGHAKIATTARYAHLDNNHVRDAPEQVGEWITAAMEVTFPARRREQHGNAEPPSGGGRLR